MPAFSNRDAVYNDIAAPGQNILSTVPRVADRGSADLRRAGLLALRHARVPRRRSARRSPRRRSPPRPRSCFSVRPDLHADQVAALLERTADDANAGDRVQAVPAAARRATPAGAR